MAVTARGGILGGLDTQARQVAEATASVSSDGGYAEGRDIQWSTHCFRVGPHWTVTGSCCRVVGLGAWHTP